MKVVFFASLVYVLVVAVLARKRLPELHPRRFFLDTWKQVDREAAEARAAREAAGLGYDWRPIAALSPHSTFSGQSMRLPAARSAASISRSMPAEAR